MTTLWNELAFIVPQLTNAIDSATFETYRQETIRTVDDGTMPGV